MESQELPDEDYLYMRAHKVFFRNAVLLEGVFRDHGSAMSTDWSRYATPIDTRNRGRIPADNAVLSLRVGDVKAIPGLSVKHTPEPSNTAHTDVIGHKSPEVRIRLRRICVIVLPLVSHVPPGQATRSTV